MSVFAGKQTQEGHVQIQNRPLRKHSNRIYVRLRPPKTLSANKRATALMKLRGRMWP